MLLHVFSVFLKRLSSFKTCFGEPHTCTVAMEASDVQVSSAKCRKRFLYVSISFILFIAVTTTGILIYDQVSFDFFLPSLFIIRNFEEF